MEKGDRESVYMGVFQSSGLSLGSKLSRTAHFFDVMASREKMKESNENMAVAIEGTNPRIVEAINGS